MTDLKTKLMKYGVNYPEVMERFVEDEELYFSCLSKFQQDPSFDGLQAALGTKAYQAAFEHAHTLKGVAGNLGLTPLYDAICGIVEPLRNHNYGNLQPQYEAILAQKQALQQLLDV